MRPDAHKKKASTQYKKKHGIAGDKKGGVREAGGARRGDEAGQGTRGAGDKAGGQAVVRPGETATTPGQNPTEADQTFKRRSVTSNWSRYEEQEDDNDEITGQLRGADFRLLLNVATTSLSQFRFADEQDWEAEPCDPASFLSIDCLDLAEALRCEPLHARLGLTPATFSTAQLQRFEASAAHHKQNYTRKVHTTMVGLEDVGDAELDLDDELSEQEASDSDTEDNTRHCGSTPRIGALAPGGSTVVQPEGNSEMPHGEVATVSASVEVVPAAAPVVPLVKAPPICVQTPPPTDSTEDDLDFLLSMDEPVKSKPDDIPEDETVSPLPVSVPPDPQPKTNVPVQSSTTNLEDWLDDFLDD